MNGSRTLANGTPCGPSLQPSSMNPTCFAYRSADSLVRETVFFRSRRRGHGCPRSYALVWARSLVALGLVCLFALAAPAQMVLLFEGFEGAFPQDNVWTVGDANPDGGAAYWEDVNFSFGGE